MLDLKLMYEWSAWCQVCDSGCRRGGWMVGCTAELRQIKRLSDGSINCLARGMSRLVQAQHGAHVLL